MTLIKRGAVFPPSPQFFDDFNTKNLFDWGTSQRQAINYRIPAVNIIECNDQFILELIAPGLSKEHFKVELSDNLLTISVEQAENKLMEGSRYVYREWKLQAFKKSFKLGRQVVEESAIHAKCEHGTLSIILPKKEEAKTLPPRQIVIS